MSIRNSYAEVGVDNFYVRNGHNYKNPHENTIIELIEKVKNEGLIGKKVLDLCCGSGEITRLLNGYDVIGVDPYTHIAYEKRTGKKASSLSFKDIVEGKLEGNFDTIICSFALHLCPESMLYDLLWNLGSCSNQLIVISPNKKPDCDNISGWKLVNEYYEKRVRLKNYINYSQS